MDRFFDNYVMTPMQRVVFDRMRPEGQHDPVGVEEARELLDTAYGWLEGVLADRRWAAGEQLLPRRLRGGTRPVLRRLGAPDRSGISQPARLPRPPARAPSFARAVDGGRPYRHLFPLGAPDRD